MTTKQTLGVAALIGGTVLVGVGIALGSRRRDTLGETSDVVHTRGGRSTLYRGRLPIQKRVRILQGLVMKGVRDPSMRKLALEITSQCPARDDMCEARAVYDWTRSNVRYTGDIAPIKISPNGPVEGIDLFQTAKRTKEFRGGDCDDHSVLNATLLTLNGIPARFRITGRGKGWSHIYVTFGAPKLAPRKWIPLDTTLPGSRFGYEAPYGKKADFPV